MAAKLAVLLHALPAYTIGSFADVPVESSPFMDACPLAPHSFDPTRQVGSIPAMVSVPPSLPFVHQEGDILQTLPLIGDAKRNSSSSVTIF